jgi:hypothetical protein
MKIRLKQSTRKKIETVFPTHEITTPATFFDQLDDGIVFNLCGNKNSVVFIGKKDEETLYWMLYYRRNEKHRKSKTIR